MNGIVQNYGEQARALGHGDAIALFAEHGFPNQKSEDWRYTPLHGLTRAAFAAAPDDAGATAAHIAPHLLKDAVARAVFVNGHFRADLSHLPAIAGVQITPRPADAWSIPASRDAAVLSLNAALARQGVQIDISSAPGLIQILHLATAAAAHGAAHLRHRLALADGARATLAETFAGADDIEYWTNAVCEIALGDSAELTHIFRQAEGGKAIHLAADRVSLAAGARYRRIELATGAALGRSGIDVEIAGPGAKAELYGALLARAGQRLVARSIIDHAVPECDSDELYKCVVAAKGVTAFQGKVIVRKDAQKTNAAQANHNLLLARGAEADSKPELEILANDVKCSHGATVGELNADALFYMQARGLNRAAAQALLVQAFVEDVFDRIDSEAIRADFSSAAHDWLEAQS